jgi:hypothetical protein
MGVQNLNGYSVNRMGICTEFFWLLDRDIWLAVVDTMLNIRVT